MTKRIIFIHGRATKPLENELRNLWYDAVKSGLKRDHGQPSVDLFDSISKDFVYYGDISNKFLHENNDNNIPDDIISRQEALATLKGYRRSEFNKRKYNDLPGKDMFKEALADTFSGFLSAVRLGGLAISTVAPDMEHYWNPESYFGSDIRNRLTTVLVDAFDSDDDVMLISHSLGTMISYDNLWKFSHYSEYRSKYGANKKVDLWVTMGSPLGDENVKLNLKGSKSKGRLRYPHNIRKWVNFSAEDDYISHDGRLRNDFKKMHKEGLLDMPLKDIYPIYNLTVRNNKSNPHSSIGYLIHPKFIDLLSEWISS